MALQHRSQKRRRCILCCDSLVAEARRALGGIFALRAHCALLLDYVPPEEPPSTPLGNALRIR